MQPATRLPIHQRRHAAQLLFTSGTSAYRESPRRDVEAIGFDSKGLQDCREQIAQGNSLVVRGRQHLMFAVPERAAREEDWQILVAVRTAISHTTAGQDHRMIEQRTSIGLFNRL